MYGSHLASSSFSQHYLQHDLKLKKFVPIIKDSVVYPVLYDAKRTVLSLPPIINGAHSAVRAWGSMGDANAANACMPLTLHDILDHPPPR